MLAKMLDFLLALRRRRSLAARITNERMHEEDLVLGALANDIDVNVLTENEKREIMQRWGRVANQISLKEYALFKAKCGFDANMLSHEVYLPLVARRLNEYHYTRFFDNKGLLGGVIHSSIPFPVCVVRRISGEYYSSDMQQITKDEAMSLCAERGEFIVKDSTFTSGGKGFLRVKLQGLIGEERMEAVKHEFGNRKSDFVCQEVIRQHACVSVFNESSVNTLRIVTLYLNGRYSMLAAVLRVGRKGSDVDNLASGGFEIGIHPDGSFYEFGYDSQFNRLTMWNGIEFKSRAIPFLPDILQQIEHVHVHEMSLCKFVGWDVAIDKGGNPVLVELNASQPGVRGVQYCCGPIFGERTDEVIAYCQGKTFTYAE